MQSAGISLSLAAAVTALTAGLGWRAIGRGIRQWRVARNAVRQLLLGRCDPPLAFPDLEQTIDWVEAEKPLAFAYGFLRPRILVTTGLAQRLSHEELRAGLMHEVYQPGWCCPISCACCRRLVDRWPEAEQRGALLYL